MTSYITITDAETDPEAPLTATLAKKWRDNPIAITEGSAGAPKISPLAFAPVAAGDVVIDKLSPQGITTSILSFTSSGAALGTLSSTYISDLGLYTVINTGTIRIKGTVSGGASGGGSFSSPTFRIYKNGTLSSSPTGTFSVDLSVTASDQIYFGGSIGYNITSSGGTVSLGLLNLTINGTQTTIWRY